MQDIYQIILFSAFSGITVFIGGLLSKHFGTGFRKTKHNNELFHFITAFGGGILLSAIALVLIPKGMEELDLSYIVIGFYIWIHADLLDRSKTGKIWQHSFAVNGNAFRFYPRSNSSGSYFRDR